MKATTLLHAPPKPSARRPLKGGNPAKPAFNPAVRIKSILVPIDFSPASLKAMDFALELARETQAKITLLHVLEIVAMPDFAGYPLVLPTDESVRGTTAELNRLARQHGYTPEVLTDVKVRKGTPFHEITSAASMLKADLIVLSTHGYTGVKRVLLGSTAERVVRHAACPVLVVPAHS